MGVEDETSRVKLVKTATTEGLGGKKKRAGEETRRA